MAVTVCRRLEDENHKGKRSMRFRNSPEDYGVVGDDKGELERPEATSECGGRSRGRGWLRRVWRVSARFLGRGVPGCRGASSRCVGVTRGGLERWSDAEHGVVLAALDQGAALAGSRGSDNERGEDGSTSAARGSKLAAKGGGCCGDLRRAGGRRMHRRRPK
jgi:hypothetical protein